MAVPTSGRVILETTVGEIEIELWAKETPKACRNFLALSMEGYYDGVIFHRVVPNFLVQTGDRTGTGGGGESFYGEHFEDEIHPRLRFAHRGLVAMANNGEKHTNDSQFFITLDRADELHGKHTLFGRVVGNTVFNVLKIGELELDKNERPLYPPKIISVRIVDNPFDDIVPRITAAEKRAQQLAKEAAQHEREEAARRKGAKKNVGLLSFGDTAEETSSSSTTMKKKSISRPDLIDDPSLHANIMPPSMPEPPRQVPPKPQGPSTSKTTSTSKKDADKDSSGKIHEIRAQHALEQASGSTVRQAEIAKMEAEIRDLTRRRKDAPDSDEEDGHRGKKAKSGPSLLEQELARYGKGRGIHSKGKKKDESDILAALDRFRGKLKVRAESPGAENAAPAKGNAALHVPEGGDEGDVPDVDADEEWMRHQLHFPKDDGAESVRAAHDYEVIDPRARGQAAKEEEMQRKRAKRRSRALGWHSGEGDARSHD